MASHIISVIKSSSMKRTRHVARMGEMRKAKFKTRSHIRD